MSASDLAAATPASRNRYVDLLRVVALGAVMLGHFLMAGVSEGADGDLVVANSLVYVPQAQLLTWVFQVMPVFFVVGGFAHAQGLRSLRRRDGTYADFADTRTRRLLEPTAAFVAFGVLTAVFVELAGTPDPTIDYAMRLIGQPLWFVGIYLLVVTLAPWTFRLHARYGVGVLVVLIASVVAVDVLRLALDVPVVGFLNFATVWLAVHQVGYFWADGRLLARPLAWRLLVGGLAVTVLLVALGPYPRSMVSLPGEAVSNLAPPSVALLSLAAAQIGLLVLLRDRAVRWLTRPRVWTAVIAANGVVMTAFLWHLTAIVVVNAVVVQAGLPSPPVGSAAWWVLRIPLLVAVAGVLALLVAVFRRFELPHAHLIAPRGLRRHHRDGWAAAGLVLALLGVLGFSVTGFSGTTTLVTRTLVVLPVTPFVNLVLLVAGWWIVGQVARPRRSPGSVAPSPPAGPTSERGHSGRA